MESSPSTLKTSSHAGDVRINDKPYGERGDLEFVM